MPNVHTASPKRGRVWLTMPRTTRSRAADDSWVATTRRPAGPPSHEPTATSMLMTAGVPAGPGVGPSVAHVTRPAPEIACSISATLWGSPEPGAHAVHRAPATTVIAVTAMVARTLPMVPMASPVVR